MPARAVACLQALLRFLAACCALAAELPTRRARDAKWALVLLAAATASHFAWLHFPASLRGHAWNIAQCLLIAFLLLMAARRYDWTVRVVAVLAGAWKLMTAGCYVAYLWRPYAGECTGALDYPLGMAALAASVGLAWLIYRGGRHVG